MKTLKELINPKDLLAKLHNNINPLPELNVLYPDANFLIATDACKLNNSNPIIIIRLIMNDDYCDYCVDEKAAFDCYRCIEDIQLEFIE